jgi:two-component system chemotaxis sensor kinase CheA
VRTNIEKIGGTVEIESAVGRGTTLKLKIPLTLAIIPALTVTSGTERYAIPQVSLLELVRLEGAQVRTGIEDFQGAPVYRLRGNLLPLVYLDALLDTKASGPASWESREINMVVVQADDRPFGLIVDAIHDTEEIVVKPLQKLLKGIGVYAGATIMGDGKVALILDVLGLAQRANVVSAVRQRAMSEKAADEDKADVDRQTLLVFAISGGGRMAIPVSQVDRLEEFPRSAIERVGPQEVIQYRNEILPLLDVADMLRSRRGTLAGRLAARQGADAVQVIVYAGKKQRIGLVVEQILDIVEEAIVVRAPANRPGVSFNAVVQGRVTEFLDVEALIGRADPDFFEQSAPSPVEVGT